MLIDARDLNTYGFQNLMDQLPSQGYMEDNSKQRMRAACELTDAEKPQPCITVDQTKFQSIYESIRQVSTNLISGSRLLGNIDVSKAQVLDLRTTNMMALMFPLPEISRFSMPEPFKGKQFTTWALIHGTPAEGAQNILLEGFIRPANWSYNPDYRRCDIPTFGGYYLGLEIGREDSFPQWAARDLMDRAQKRGKGQQKVLIGALYCGADNHISFKAGGHETAQLNIPHCGSVPTSEKDTSARLNGSSPETGQRTTKGAHWSLILWS
jgi:hypothetical protein